MDFRELIKPYHNNPNAFLILDPLYLQTNIDGYKENFYRLADFLELADLIRPPYIFFSNTKSDIKEFLEWYDKKQGKDHNERKIYISNTANTGNLEGISDYMFYEF